LDYILIGSDGIYDRLKNEQINQIVWDVATQKRHVKDDQGFLSIHKICGLIADEILNQAARNHSLDNLSIVFVAFQKFKDYVEQGREPVKQQMPAEPIIIE
jgi:serine/threonine protein phosphatase PrpC